MAASHSLGSAGRLVASVSDWAAQWVVLQCILHAVASLLQSGPQLHTRTNHQSASIHQDHSVPVVPSGPQCHQEKTRTIIVVRVERERCRRQTSLKAPGQRREREESRNWRSDKRVLNRPQSSPQSNVAVWLWLFSSSKIVMQTSCLASIQILDFVGVWGSARAQLRS